MPVSVLVVGTALEPLEGFEFVFARTAADALSLLDARRFLLAVCRFRPPPLRPASPAAAQPGTDSNPEHGSESCSNPESKSESESESESNSESRSEPDSDPESEPGSIADSNSGPGMESGIATLRALRARAPSLRCVLLADYADLPEIVGARARGLLSRVIPNGAAAPALAAGLRAALEQEEEPSSSRSTVRGEAGDALDALIHFSATRLAQVQGAIVRPLAPDPRALQLQFVLRGEKRIESLRRDLNRRWGLPIKARGGDLATRWRGHPAPKRLGRLTGEAELWCVQPEGEPSCAYLALLPWSREPRLTAVVGLVAPGASASAAGLLADAHRQALSALAEFSLPAAPETVRDERLGTAAPEYDWIVTNTYVGLDRRQAPTTLLNRFIFFGRRRHVPARLLRATDSFTDRPSRRVLPWFILYIAFATVDTVLTWWCVRTGLVRESNPLLRPLVLHHPAVYLLVKNGLALLAFLVIARFQLFRIGGLLLTAAVLAWVALDLYWLALLVRMRG